MDAAARSSPDTEVVHSWVEVVHTAVASRTAGLAAVAEDTLAGHSHQLDNNHLLGGIVPFAVVLDTPHKAHETLVLHKVQVRNELGARDKNRSYRKVAMVLTSWTTQCQCAASVARFSS